MSDRFSPRRVLGRLAAIGAAAALAWLPAILPGLAYGPLSTALSAVFPTTMGALGGAALYLELRHLHGPVTSDETADIFD